MSLVCEYCQATYRKASLLACHVRTHTGERPYACTWEGCEQTYMRADHLRRHVATTHSSERPFKCEQCDISFATKCHLRRHQRLHDQPKPYACTHEGCEERFAKHNQLRLHTSTHTGELPYLCTHEGCGKTFTYPNILKKHIAKCHSNEKRYLCGTENCQKSFFKYIELLRHQQKEHPVLLTCQICSKVFHKASTLSRHIHLKHENSETFTCVTCGKEYTSRSNLKTHIHSAHEKVTYDCEVCERKFKHKCTLRNHKRTHENEHNPTDKIPRKKRRSTEVLLGTLPPRIQVEEVGITLENNHSPDFSDIEIEVLDSMPFQQECNTYTKYDEISRTVLPDSLPYHSP